MCFFFKKKKGNTHIYRYYEGKEKLGVEQVIKGKR